MVFPLVVQIHSPSTRASVPSIQQPSGKPTPRFMHSYTLYNLPEPKGFLIEFVRRRHCSCCVVNFSNFRLLLYNHWANFNQACFKASFGEGFQICLIDGSRPFPRGDNNKIAKVH